MKVLVLVAAAMLLAACADDAMHHAATPGGPDDPNVPTVQRPYSSVMAGTVDHGLGEQP
jgi:hypothetical protein